MKNLKFLLISVLAVGIFTGCADKTEYMSNGKPSGGNEYMTLGLDRADFEKAASDAVENLLSSGVLNKKGGGRYVVAIGRVINDTTQRIDTDLLTKKIRIAMLNSGKAVITSAISGDGSNEEGLIGDIRDMRGDDEVNQKTLPPKGSIYAPNFALSGKIIQRTSLTASKKALVAYYFQLTLTDLETGLAFWEDESVIEKIGSAKSVSW